MARRALGTLRIIGGEWRSRLIEFDADAGVRPTPDRVRQTVFDWLSPLIAGASCLDLFAGSGALGFEALSRGASHTSFIEQGRDQAVALRAAAARLAASDRAEIVQTDALSWLRNTARRYDVVFLDPPYGDNLLAPALAALPGLLKPMHRVYLEWPIGQAPQLPPGYSLLKEKSAGQVSYGLAVFKALEPVTRGEHT